MEELRAWIFAAEAAKVTCGNLAEFNQLIRNQKRRLQQLVLAAYRERFPLKPMRRPPTFDDELIQMPRHHGVYELLAPPATETQFPRAAALPRTKETAREARQLWVIRSTDFPVALEACPWGKKLRRGSITHSNLTGGSEAHSAGEIWFVADDHVAVNASSGRYGAESADEFKIIVDALRRFGYYVASMGFDLDNVTVPNTVFVGEPEWEAPL
jgi:hypothetical protein